MKNLTKEEQEIYGAGFDEGFEVASNKYFNEASERVSEAYKRGYDKGISKTNAQEYQNGMLTAIQQFYPDYKEIVTDDRVIKILLPDNTWHHVIKYPIFEEE